jgi:hypothetical protein
MAKKIKTAIEETVTETVTDIREEANEEVGTLTFKRWQVVVAAVVLTVALLVVIL